jgi:hypothetical protein
MGQRQRGAYQLTYILLHKTMLLFVNGFSSRICNLCKICRLKCTFGANLHIIQIAYRASVYVALGKIIL